jgi:hypothetical protein
MPRLRDPVSCLWLLAALVALTVPAGCARKPERTIYGNSRAVLAELDDFGVLLLSAGLLPEALPTGAEVTVEEAGRLRLLVTLLQADGSMQRYGPRVTADFLLEEIFAGGQAVSRVVLNERLRRFERLAVLRPDGYLASVLSGTAIQCVGPIQIQEGALGAGGYRLGVLYTPEGAGFREDTSLLRPPPAVARTAGPASQEAK